MASRGVPKCKTVSDAHQRFMLAMATCGFRIFQPSKKRKPSICSWWQQCQCTVCCHSGLLARINQRSTVVVHAEIQQESMKSRRVCHSAKLWHSLNKIKVQREGHLSCTAAQWRMLTSVFQLKEKGNEKLHPAHSPRNLNPCLKSKPLTSACQIREQMEGKKLQVFRSSRS